MMSWDRCRWSVGRESGCQQQLSTTVGKNNSGAQLYKQCIRSKHMIHYFPHENSFLLKRSVWAECAHLTHPSEQAYAYISTESLVCKSRLETLSVGVDHGSEERRNSSLHTRRGMWENFVKVNTRQAAAFRTSCRGLVANEKALMPPRRNPQVRGHCCDIFGDVRCPSPPPHTNTHTQRNTVTLLYICQASSYVFLHLNVKWGETRIVGWLQHSSGRRSHPSVINAALDYSQSCILNLILMVIYSNFGVFTCFVISLYLLAFYFISHCQAHC